VKYRESRKRKRINLIKLTGVVATMLAMIGELYNTYEEAQSTGSDGGKDITYDEWESLVDEAFEKIKPRLIKQLDEALD
tara:strand:+ start:288 stop:524 length:237 start_codon:yes stop_codon:yes gene_type:complete